MNKIILTGNLCKSIELRQTQSGVNVVSNSVAVSRDIKDAKGEYQTDFIDIVVWGQSAEYLSKYGEKGARVELCGRLQNRTYQANDGSNRTINEVQVESIKVFSKKKEEEPTTQNKNTNAIEVNEDELPF